MIKLRILCALVCVQLAGCATCYDLQYRAAKHFKTHSAWKCSGATSPCHPAHYKDGWKEGYYSVATGGCGKLPPVPPKRYWKAKYQTTCGRDQVATWYRGYQEGVVVAQATCVRSWNPVPTSCNAALPTQPCQQCAGVYHEPPTVHAVQDAPAHAAQTVPYVPRAPEAVLPPEAAVQVPSEAPNPEPVKQAAPEAPEVEQLPSNSAGAPKVSKEEIPAQESFAFERLPNIVEPEPYQESLYRIPPVSKEYEARQTRQRAEAEQRYSPIVDIEVSKRINEQLEAAFVKHAPSEYQTATRDTTVASQIVPSPPATKPVEAAKVKVVKVRAREVQVETPSYDAPKVAVDQAQSNTAKTTLKISRPQKVRAVVAKKRKTKPFRLDTAKLSREVTVAWSSLEKVTRQGQQVWQQAVSAAEEAKSVARIESIPAEENSLVPLAESPQAPLRWHGENNSTFRPASLGRSELVLKGHEPEVRIAGQSPTRLRILPNKPSSEARQGEVIVETDQAKRNYRVSDRSSIRFR